MRDPIYLDYNATAPIRPEVRDAVIAAFDVAGNPSSVHGFGRRARRVVEDARAEVAALAEVTPARVVFTSGGTEANTAALRATGPHPRSGLSRSSTTACWKRRRTRYGSRSPPTG